MSFTPPSEVKDGTASVSGSDAFMQRATTPRAGATRAPVAKRVEEMDAEIMMKIRECEEEFKRCEVVAVWRSAESEDKTERAGLLVECRCLALVLYIQGMVGRQSFKSDYEQKCDKMLEGCVHHRDCLWLLLSTVPSLSGAPLETATATRGHRRHRESQNTELPGPRLHDVARCV